MQSCCSRGRDLEILVNHRPLGAGAQEEVGTWGINIKNQSVMPKANFQELPGRYACLLYTSILKWCGIKPATKWAKLPAR